MLFLNFLLFFQHLFTFMLCIRGINTGWLFVITVYGVRRKWSSSWRVLTQSKASKLGTTVVHASRYAQQHASRTQKELKPRGSYIVFRKTTIIIHDITLIHVYWVLNSHNNVAIRQETSSSLSPTEWLQALQTLQGPDGYSNQSHPSGSTTANRQALGVSVATVANQFALWTRSALDVA